MKRLVVICGVAASGKTTIGQALSQSLGCPFVEGDDFHPPQNVDKMSSGQPLTDQDRIVWIEAIAQSANDADEPSLVLACSALTPFVREKLINQCNRNILWIVLDVPQSVAVNRAQGRDSHFMPSELIQSQFDAWSPPVGIKVDTTLPLPEIVVQITNALY